MTLLFLASFIALAIVFLPMKATQKVILSAILSGIVAGHIYLSCLNYII
jgi:hypothetical protein